MDYLLKGLVGTPCEAAEKLLDMTSGNPKAALIEFIIGHSADKDRQKAEASADRHAQGVLDYFSDLLASEVGFFEVTDAAYLTALNMMAMGAELILGTLGKLGHLDGGVTDISKPKKRVFHCAETLVGGKAIAFVSRHKFGAYPDAAVLLSDNKNLAVEHVLEMVKRDRKLDPCEGVWEHEIKLVTIIDDHDNKPVATAIHKVA